MTNEQFLQQFGHFIDAPNGIKKLRELILQLAVQGKLVPQDPDDEPASVLLEKIKAEKERLIKEKIARKTKLPVLPNEYPSHELPSSWVWTNLYEIGEISPRNNHDDDIKASFIPMKCISDTYSVPVQHEIRQWKEIKSGFTHFKEGDVVLAKITPCFQNGKSAVVRGLTNGFGAGTTELHVYRPPTNSIVPEYVLIYLKSPGFIHEGIPKMTGTAGQKRITRDYFAGNHFPLPPLGEQSRIVDKVDELMSLCDQLETEQNARGETHTSLIRAAHHHLTEAGDTTATQTAWQRIRDNFTGLYTTTDAVQALRQAILQLAVQGKLVSQDPDDEPASVLLETIKVEKELVLADKIYSKLKKLPSNENTDPLYELPQSWSWSLLDEITYTVHYGYTASADHSIKDVRLLRITDIQNNRVNWSTVPGCEITEKKYKANSLNNDDILIARTGGTIGKTYLVENLSVRAVFASYLIRAVPCRSVNPKYLKAFMETPLYWSQLYEKSAGTGQPNVNATSLRGLQTPLPPLAEQSHIVTKVDELMILCDHLETQINSKSTTASRYAEAIVQKIAAA